jgi:hypothetical protein
VARFAFAEDLNLVKLAADNNNNITSKTGIILFNLITLSSWDSSERQVGARRLLSENTLPSAMDAATAMARATMKTSGLMTV